jgi:hypothetical protein
LSALRTGRLYHQEYPCTHFERLSRPGIDPGTFRLVAERLNHYATPGSNVCLFTPTVRSWYLSHFSFQVFTSLRVLNDAVYQVCHIFILLTATRDSTTHTERVAIFPQQSGYAKQPRCYVIRTPPYQLRITYTTEYALGRCRFQVNSGQTPPTITVRTTEGMLPYLLTYSMEQSPS